MRVEWTINTQKELEKIYRDTIKQSKSEKIAANLFNQIIDAADLLEIFPQAGPIELLLDSYSSEFRSLIVHKHYKLIYILLNEIVKIVAVWDTRQNPNRLVRKIKSI